MVATRPAARARRRAAADALVDLPKELQPVRLPRTVRSVPIECTRVRLCPDACCLDVQLRNLGTLLTGTQVSRRKSEPIPRAERRSIGKGSGELAHQGAVQHERLPREPTLSLGRHRQVEEVACANERSCHISLVDRELSLVNAQVTVNIFWVSTRRSISNCVYVRAL